MAFERSKEDPSTKNISNRDSVNTTTPYEQLMAAKLDHVPVPDMSDGIWAGIENQLDAGVNAGTPKGRGWWYGFIGLVAVVTLILLWRHYAHKANAPERTAPKESVPIIKEPLPARDSSTIINKPKKKQLPVEPVRIKKDTLLHSNNSVDSGYSEYTPLTRRDISPVRDDSVSRRHNRDRPPHMDTVTIQPAGKKHRGVRGITDEDYKISARKDSAGRKD
jgi:hypothetical protein